MARNDKNQQGRIFEIARHVGSHVEDLSIDLGNALAFSVRVIHRGQLEQAHAITVFIDMAGSHMKPQAVIGICPVIIKDRPARASIPCLFQTHL